MKLQKQSNRIAKITQRSIEPEFQSINLEPLPVEKDIRGWDFSDWLWHFPAVYVKKGSWHVVFNYVVILIVHTKISILTAEPFISHLLLDFLDRSFLTLSLF